jgi:hypothetical protein
MDDEAIKKLLEGIDGDEDGASKAGAVDPRILIEWPGAREAKKHDEDKSTDDDEEEEVREIDKSSLEVKDAGHDTNWDALTPSFKAGDVVWKLIVRDWHDRFKKLPCTDATLKMSANEFKQAHLYIEAGLCVLKFCGFSTKGAIHHALVWPVFDQLGGGVPSLSAAIPEEVEKIHLFRYERIYDKNVAIFGAIKRSVTHLMNRPDVFDKMESLERQHTAVRDFFRRHDRHPRLKSYCFLPVDDLARRSYLALMLGDDQVHEWYSTMSNKDQVPSQVAECDGGEKDDREEDGDDNPETIVPAKEPVSFSTDSDDVKKDEEGNEDRFRGPSEINLKVMQYFKTEKVQRNLKKIMTGTLASRRHDLLTSPSSHITMGNNLELCRLANEAFLDEDNLNDKDLFHLLVEKVFSPWAELLKIGGKRGKKDHSFGFQRDYVFGCLVPEGIIMYLMEVEGVGYQEAEEKYMNTTGKMGRRKRKEWSREGIKMK